MGYILIEEKQLASAKALKPNPEQYGFLDFLRKLKEDPFPFDENSKLLVFGLEDILLFYKENVEAKAREIHTHLQKAAKDLDRCNIGPIQMVFKSELLSGANLVLRHPALDLPIYIIFGSPTPEQTSGQTYFPCSFNLSSAH